MYTKEFLTHNPYLPIYEEMADCTYYGKPTGKPTGKLPLIKKQKKARIKNKLAKQARKIHGGNNEQL